VGFVSIVPRMMYIVFLALQSTPEGFSCCNGILLSHTGAGSRRRTGSSRGSFRCGSQVLSLRSDFLGTSLRVRSTISRRCSYILTLSMTSSRAVSCLTGSSSSQISLYVCYIVDAPPVFDDVCLGLYPFCNVNRAS